MMLLSKEVRAVKLFLRLALAAGFLSASADRFGLWPKSMSVWGDWHSFVLYTKTLLFNAPDVLAAIAAGGATAAEVILGIFLLVGLKLRLTAQFSAALLLIFGISMLLAVSVKAPLDYSVFTAAAAAMALAAMERMEPAGGYAAA